VDGSITNEGSLTVGAGTATTSLIQSNTSGSTAVTLQAGTNVTLSESGNTITIDASGSTDNLGNHSATQDLDMNFYDIIDLDTLQWNYSGAGDTKMFVDGDDVFRIYQGNAYSAAGEIISGQPGGGLRIDGAYTLPATDGTNGYVLKTNGSGTVSWSADSGGDNLGNHTATTTLNMNGNTIDDATAITFEDGNGDTDFFAVNENFTTGNWQVQSDNQANPALTVSDAMVVGISSAYTLPTTGGSSGQFLRTSGSVATWAAVNHVKGVSVESPTSSENLSLFYTDHAITITRVSDVVQGTSPSVTYNIRHASTRNSGTPNNVFSANRTVTSTSGATTTTFNDATIPANSWVWLITSATSGTVNEVNVTIQYVQD
jgi:hypothetical protein